MAAPVTASNHVILCLIFASDGCTGPPKRQLELVETTKTVKEVMDFHKPPDFTVDEIFCAKGDVNNLRMMDWMNCNSAAKVGIMVTGFGINILRAVMRTPDAEPVPPRSSVNPFVLMMSRRLALPPPKDRSSGVRDGISQKDKLYNALLEVFTMNEWLWNDDADAQYVIQVITNGLWVITNSHSVIQEAADHNKKISPLPDIFGQFKNYDTVKMKKRKHIPLNASDMDSHGRNILALTEKPSLQYQRLYNLKEALVQLSKTFTTYSSYLKEKSKNMSAVHQQPHPARPIDENISVQFRPGVGVVKSEFLKYEELLKQTSDWDPVLFDETSLKLMDRIARFEYFKNFAVSVDVWLIKYCPGGNIFGIVHVVKVPPSSEDTRSTMLARIVAGLKPKLPEYHTRAMKLVFKEKMSNICNMSPAVLSLVYSELSGDASAVDNPVMTQRLILAATGEPGIVPDLRFLNPGRPSNTFDIFWEEAEKVINEFSAVDERRHGVVAHFSEFISYPDLLKRIADRCPPGTKIPTTATLRLQTSPTNKYTARAQAFTGRLQIQHKIQVRQLRAHHPDAHFCAAMFKYMRQRATQLKDVLMVFFDDKAKVPIGEPDVPISTGVRGRSVPTPSNIRLDACDHDVASKAKLTPTVLLMPEIPDNYEKSWYQGDTTIILHDSIREQSNAYRNASILIREHQNNGLDKPVVFKFSDGGAEHRNVFIKVQLSYVAIFKILGLDMIVAARCAPGQSWLNPVERINAIANLALQNMSTSRNRCSAEVEAKLKNLNSMADIRKKAAQDETLAGEWTNSLQPVISLIAGRLERLELKGKQFRVKSPILETEVIQKLKELFPNIDPNNVTKASAMADQDVRAFFDAHCRERQYSFQVRKINNCVCCGLARTSDDERAWLPDPMPDGAGEHYLPLQEVLNTETNDSHRPGLKPATRGPQAAKAPENVFMKEAIGNQNVPSLFVTQHAREVVRCLECDKPRVIYAKKALTHAQKLLLQSTLSENDYTCGCAAVPPENLELCNIAQARVNITCGDTIEISYYHKKLGKMNICAFCANSGAKIGEELRKSWKTVLPSCASCTALGRVYKALPIQGVKRKR